MDGTVAEGLSVERPHITIDMRWNRAERTLVECFRDAPSGNVSDAAGRVVGMPNAIKPITSAYRFCGTALTIDNGRTGNLGVWAALEYVQPGDVLVIATGEARERAVIGDLLAGFAFNSGAVAVVTDGMVRDQETLEHFGKPVFAGGITPIGPIGDGPCRVGTPITLGSQVVCSGDLVVGDLDGVVVVAQAKLASSVGALTKITEKERGMETQVKAGARVPAEAEAILAAAQITRLED